MMTLRLEKDRRTEFYECDTAVTYPRDKNGVISIAAYRGGEITPHHVGPLPGQAFEAFLMNSTGKTVEVIRHECP